MTEHTKWENEYRTHINNFKNLKSYYNYKIKSKKTFINAIIKYAEKDRPLIEAGSGTGLISTYLTELGKNVTAVDIDPKMIEFANEINRNLSLESPNFVNADIFNLPYSDNSFTVCFNYGVLEHYNKKQIIDLINEQLRIATYCIFGVPTEFFKNNSMHGDENYLSMKEWQEIINLTSGILLKTKKQFNFHYYKHLFSLTKIFNFHQFYIFIVKKKL